MAKATITFTDTDDGGFECNLDFEPPVNNDTYSRAQLWAIKALELITNDMACNESEDE